MHVNCAGGIGLKGFMNSFNWDKNFETGIGVCRRTTSIPCWFYQSLRKPVVRECSLYRRRRRRFLDLTLCEFHFKEESLMRDCGLYDLHIEEHIKVHRVYARYLQHASFHLGRRSGVQHVSYWTSWFGGLLIHPRHRQNMARQVAAIEQGATP